MNEKLQNKKRIRGHFMFKLKTNTMFKRFSKGFNYKIPKFNYTQTEVQRIGLKYKEIIKTQKNISARLRSNSKIVSTT